MVFDRSAINVGRRIQDFGLCDLTGIYQNSTKLRTKGYLVVGFLSSTDSSSAAVAKELESWKAISDKLSICALALGEREEAQNFAALTSVTFPVLWDADNYTSQNWGVNEVPALFITDSQGIVMDKVIGNDIAPLKAAKDLLTEVIRKADEAAKAAADAAAAQAAAAPVKA